MLRIQLSDRGEFSQHPISGLGKLDEYILFYAGISAKEGMGKGSPDILRINFHHYNLGRVSIWIII